LGGSEPAKTTYAFQPSTLVSGINRNDRVDSTVRKATAAEQLGHPLPP
jgi:hypothetical protein